MTEAQATVATAASTVKRRARPTPRSRELLRVETDTKAFRPLSKALLESCVSHSVMTGGKSTDFAARCRCLTSPQPAAGREANPFEGADKALSHEAIRVEEKCAHSETKCDAIDANQTARFSVKDPPGVPGSRRLHGAQVGGAECREQVCMQAGD
ncbi:hypothetical protein PF005_g29759 [Phytophthora fragariae]|uniref:Uncharacterized protein n=2 Tax=Phytophthora fragariae TaxID=53985 RepID=A0A6A3PWV6_9STRA|nr:hypothetical protein PF009_g30107 [Phytophthora fragariae]KAE9062454.1 hypothetical protein PF010_g29397 [Phytophthora fragariae]KAE9063367.1 hypothetical protein PF007_g29576 [Phytophthora fragariae]KAE9165080.1 hypothetical protein PF005_g29759 [Phytophthora fragariae]KAE9167293.1 hypothetical protein PF004_g28869 [Phytophthora fragariae]